LTFFHLSLVFRSFFARFHSFFARFSLIFPSFFAHFRSFFFHFRSFFFQFPLISLSNPPDLSYVACFGLPVGDRDPLADMSTDESGLVDYETFKSMMLAGRPPQHRINPTFDVGGNT
jgi:hypothetical protein